METTKKEARVGSWYVIGVWDADDPGVVGHSVTGRLVSKKVRPSRYPGDVFWLVEGAWITYLIPRHLIQQVDEYRRYNF